MSLATGKREATKAANRAAILAAAREVFGELGFGAASVRDIIRRTDLAAGTFYNHFPDKESLLVGFITHETEEYVATLERSLEDIEDPIEQLRT